MFVVNFLVLKHGEHIDAQATKDLILGSGRYRSYWSSISCVEGTFSKRNVDLWLDFST